MCLKGLVLEDLVNPTAEGSRVGRRFSPQSILGMPCCNTFLQCFWQFFGNAFQECVLVKYFYYCTMFSNTYVFNVNSIHIIFIVYAKYNNILTDWVTEKCQNGANILILYSLQTKSIFKLTYETREN